MGTKLKLVDYPAGWYELKKGQHLERWVSGISAADDGKVICVGPYGVNTAREISEIGEPCEAPFWADYVYKPNFGGFSRVEVIST